MSRVAKEASPARSWLWLQGLLCGAAVSLMPATCVVVTALLGPAVMASFFETNPKKPVSRVMIMLDVAAIIAPLRTLWETGNSIDLAIAIVSDPSNLALAWLATCSGWIVSEGSGMAAFEFTAALIRRRCTALRQERSALESEWGKAGPAS